MLTRGGHRLVEEDVAYVASKLIEKLLVKLSGRRLVVCGRNERAIGGNKPAPGSGRTEMREQIVLVVAAMMGLVAFARTGGGIVLVWRVCRRYRV